MIRVRAYDHEHHVTWTHGVGPEVVGWVDLEPFLVAALDCADCVSEPVGTFPLVRVTDVLEALRDARARATTDADALVALERELERAAP